MLPTLLTGKLLKTSKTIGFSVKIFDTPSPSRETSATSCLTFFQEISASASNMYNEHLQIQVSKKTLNKMRSLCCPVENGAFV